MHKIPLLTLIIALALGGCAHSIHQVHVSDFSQYTSLKGAKVIRANAEQFVIMHFTTQTDYVDQAYRKLLDLCKNGRILGVTTQHSTSLGFLSWHNKVLMKGHCVRS